MGNCYFEIPILANFMLIMVILGYLYVLRIFITMLHYKFGVRIYRYMRRNLRIFRRFDRQLNAKFPVYNYEGYLNIL